MADLKTRLRADLTTAMKARDELGTATLRMLLTAVTNEEVSGSTAQVLSDEQVTAVISREAKKRREAAEAFTQGNRPEQAQRELDEERVLMAYLPEQLTDEELTSLVTQAITEAGATEPRQMGIVMKAVQPAIAGRADGKRVSDEVRRQLAG
jgi:uncharacterized protein YqeY